MKNRYCCAAFQFRVDGDAIEIGIWEFSAWKERAWKHKNGDIWIYCPFCGKKLVVKDKVNSKAKEK